MEIREGGGIGVLSFVTTSGLQVGSGNTSIQ